VTKGTRGLAAWFLLLAALWFGMLGFFGAFGARVVLETSPSRHAAGAVNKVLLDVLDAASLLLAFLLALALVLWNRARPWTARARGYALRFLAVAAVAAAASLFVVTPEMMERRARMGPVDLVPKEDPLRKAWGRLHGVSSLTLLVRLAASAGVFAAAFSQLPKGDA
jgi:glucan phosphoethanolaminetransferase (alkaline phosphatase superfamily)